MLVAVIGIPICSVLLPLIAETGIRHARLYHRLAWHVRLPVVCGEARNKDSVFGVIGFRKGPPGDGVHSAPEGIGSRVWDAGCETIATIRRAHFVQGKPIKQICRELKLSRKLVRKVLRPEETAVEHKRSVQPAEARRLAGRARPAAGGERRAGQPGAGDAAADLRRPPRSRLRGRV